MKIETILIIYAMGFIMGFALCAAMYFSIGDKNDHGNNRKK